MSNLINEDIYSNALNIAKEYETKNDFLVPTTIIRPDGKIIANGWR